MESGYSIEKSSTVSTEEPLLAGEQPPPKGGFRTIPFILASQTLQNLATYGLLPNMILYLTTEYGMGAAEAANVLFLWSAVTNFVPIIGAFLADSHVGRFLMIGIGSIVSLLGVLLLWTTTIFPQAKPFCDKSTHICQPSSIPQLLLLYSSFALISIGAGGSRSPCLAFAADQLTNLSEKTSKPNIATSALERLFRWYYISIMVAGFLAQTCLVYIQANIGWEVGFGVSLVLMIFSVVSFFLASPFYVKVKGNPGLLTGLVQVLVASFRNRHIQLSSDDESLYHQKKGSSLAIPYGKLRLLNKACVISNPQEDLTLNGNASNPWTLCTVDQVEELKSLINVVPIWSTGIVLSVTCAQSSFVVLEARSMNRDTVIPGFEIPPGSFGVFMIISFAAFLALYDRVIIPIVSKIRGKPIHLGLKQRMGSGLLISVFAVASLATTEFFRRKTAIEEGFAHDPRAETSMSAMWLLPYMLLVGIAEAMNAVAQNEFYYTELPKTMSSIATTLYGVGMSAASLVSSLIINVVDDVSDRWGDASWVSSNINVGHLDYYYWVITGLCVVNFVYFIGCSRAYGECKGEGRLEGLDEEEGK